MTAVTVYTPPLFMSTPDSQQQLTDGWYTIKNVEFRNYIGMEEVASYTPLSNPKLVSMTNLNDVDPSMYTASFSSHLHEFPALCCLIIVVCSTTSQ